MNKNIAIKALSKFNQLKNKNTRCNRHPDQNKKILSGSDQLKNPKFNKTPLNSMQTSNTNKTLKQVQGDRNTECITHHHAFTLVELLISLITIACITAAFSPLISKRLANSHIISPTGSLISISNKCIDKGYDEDCKLCNTSNSNKTCLVCDKDCDTLNLTQDTGKCICCPKGCDECNNYDSDDNLIR